MPRVQKILEQIWIKSWVFEMKSFDEFSEDLETRRQLLKQRQTDQAASFKEKGAANVDAQRNRVAAAKEKQADVQSRIDDAKERAREAEMARKEAEKEREAERQEREDLKDQEITQSKEDKKSNDQKRMSKVRIQQKRRESAQQAMKES